MPTTQKVAATRWLRRLGGDRLARLRGWLRPLAIALLISLALIRMDPSEMADLEISDRLQVRQRHRANPAVLIVEITPQDARKYDGPPFNRTVLASMIDKLADGGAGRVLFDSYLGSSVVPQNDARLAQAFARLGPDRLGLVTSARPSDLPLPLFAQHATVVDARLTPDSDGRHRRIGRADRERGANAARWLGTGIVSMDPVVFDLRIRPSQFERVSMDDVVSGRAMVRDRLVVITLSSEISPSRAFLPSLRNADRGAAFAVGAQSARSGFGKDHPKAALLEAMLIGLAMLGGIGCALAANNWQRMVLYSLAVLATLSSTSLSIAYYFASQAHPSHVISSFMIFLNLFLLHRLGILPMMTSFLRGDISPDEAWAWRTFEPSQHPALLFGFNGRVKRCNAAAKSIMAEHGEILDKLSQPRWSERDETIDLADGDGRERHFQLDWPFEHIPLLVMRDVTEAEAIQRKLEEQLQTDPLTGQANRRGFDQALVAASKADKGYALLFIDMNGFKAVNDTYGHDAGDELLVVVAQRLTNLLRGGDTLARLGGDEFGIIAKGIDTAEEAALLQGRIVQAVSRPVALSCVDRTVQVGAAIGYALSRPGDGRTDELLREADQAMYRDKRAAKLRAA